MIFPSTGWKTYSESLREGVFERLVALTGSEAISLVAGREEGGLAVMWSAWILCLSLEGLNNSIAVRYSLESLLFLP